MPHELINKGLSYAGQAYAYVRSLPARYHKLKFGTKVFIWCVPPPPSPAGPPSPG